ncbi:MAG TPA: polyprenyl synthetase family protein [Bacillota bacterium]|nr:polyprenyl synthetase family protein [Bacillota bacterium]
MSKASIESSVQEKHKNGGLLAEVYRPILGPLTEVENKLAELWPEDKLFEELPRLNFGGKRIRPAMVLLSSLSGKGPCPEVLKLAISVEILHLATLVHDDIIDNSETRHGAPTLNKLLGGKTAVLIGDYLYALFLEHAAGLGRYSLSRLSRVLKDMIRAEIEQQTTLFNCKINEKDYLRRISLKTGRFFSCCCKLGARAAGAGENFMRYLELFGWLLGISFQIKDDLLDFTGDTASLGKPVAQDLRQGVLTLPVIHTLRHSPLKKEITGLIEKKELSEKTVTFIISEIIKSDSLAYTEKTAAEYARLAGRLLAGLPQNDGRESLSALLDFVLTRNY